MSLSAKDGRDGKAGYLTQRRLIDLKMAVIIFQNELKKYLFAPSIYRKVCKTLGQTCLPRSEVEATI
jgi:hypothetical protein